jgi:thymidylate synthase (FAD)
MKTITVLDHGSVALVEHWGSDERIIEAARMSTQKGFKGWGTQYECEHGSLGSPCTLGCSNVKERLGDEKLLAYLWKNKHLTPFEMAGMVIEVQAPIFVFREWHRHRTQSYNEMSARYEPLPDVNYIPTVERLLINAGGTNKQAGTAAGASVLDDELAVEFKAQLSTTYKEAQNLYVWALARGVPKELARLIMPVGRYSRMRASANLRNWLAFLTLRMDTAAQWEIRQYANAVHNIVKELFPRTVALFDEGGAR